MIDVALIFFRIKKTKKHRKKTEGRRQEAETASIYFEEGEIIGDHDRGFGRAHARMHSIREERRGRRRKKTIDGVVTSTFKRIYPPENDDPAISRVK